MEVASLKTMKRHDGQLVQYIDTNWKHTQLSETDSECELSLSILAWMLIGFKFTGVQYGIKWRTVQWLR